VKTAALSVILLGLLAACEAPVYPANGTGDLLLAASLQRAIVVQSTLFPYHFVPGSAELNELGQRDLAVLARHFQGHAGALSVRRGDATPELEDARIKAVLTALVAAGVGKDKVSVRDGLPGGEGLASARVIEILKAPLTLSGAGVSQVTSTATATTASTSSNFQQ
jgi:hypothetical protein